MHRVESVRSYLPDENLIYRELFRAESKSERPGKEVVSVQADQAKEPTGRRTQEQPPAPPGMEFFQLFFKPYQKDLAEITATYRVHAEAPSPAMIQWESAKERVNGLTEYMIEQYEMSSYNVFFLKGIRCDYLV
ncbi:MAG: hypothetical protein EA360_09425 [Balneolaceae bacterium]|nr:MAG: hypothetical protein EA360_09425 [Balneolaceae bacterium]